MFRSPTIERLVALANRLKAQGRYVEAESVMDRASKEYFEAIKRVAAA